MTVEASCSDLRCSRPVVRIFIPPAGPPTIRFGVCEEHDAHLRGGGDWRVLHLSPDPLDPNGELVCSPDDMNADGTLIAVSSASYSRLSYALLSSRPEHVHVVGMETGRWGSSPDGDEVRVVMTEEQALELRDLLCRVLGTPEQPPS
jgi:hypothetical protein